MSGVLFIAPILYYIFRKNSTNSIRLLKSVVFRLGDVYPEKGYSHNILCERFNFKDLKSRSITHQIVFLYKMISSVIDCIWLLNKLQIKIPKLSSRVNNIFNLSVVGTNAINTSPFIKWFLVNINVENNILRYIFCTNAQTEKYIHS